MPRTKKCCHDLSNFQSKSNMVWNLRYYCMCDFAFKVYCTDVGQHVRCIMLSTVWYIRPIAAGTPPMLVQGQETLFSYLAMVVPEIGWCRSIQHEMKRNQSVPSNTGQFSPCIVLNLSTIPVPYCYGTICLALATSVDMTNHGQKYKITFSHDAENFKSSTF